MNCSFYIRTALLCILVAFSLNLTGVGAQPRAQEQDHALYLPLVRSGAGAAPTPAPPAPTPQPGSLPAALVGTWFSGQLLPRALYDPTTGQWGSANGLGQLYEFAADGAYTYLAFFRIENPGCASEVSVYRHGTASASGGILTMRPTTVKTRTVISCGERQETVTDGPYDTRTIPWSVGHNQFGVVELTIVEDGKTTTYFKDGMAQELVGAWHNGDITSAGFYNPATGAFAADPGEGWWISIAADGHYRWGEFAHVQNDQGCLLAGWLYLEGTVSVSGSHITFTPSSGVARVENACAPDQPRQEPWQEDAKGFTWLLRDRETSVKLVLIPDGRFEEYEFLPE
jgi:hypothetical protein